jgi:parvulin-like peptidyl-prolyl isomerase
VRRIWFRVAGPEDDAASAARAADAARRLGAGEAFEAVRTALGDAEIAPVPDALLPPAKLLDYLGPTALRAADELAPGAASAPMRGTGGYQVVQLVERGPTERAPLADVRETLVAELRRERGEQALRRYLDDLRRGAHVELAEPLP